MSDRPDWLPETLPPEPPQTSSARRVTSLLVAGAGLLLLIPPIYATILDWQRHGLAVLIQFLPCCTFLALPLFLAAWRIRSGPLPRRRGFEAGMSNTLLIALLLADAILLGFLLSSWLK